MFFGLSFLLLNYNLDYKYKAIVYFTLVICHTLYKHWITSITVYSYSDRLLGPNLLIILLYPLVISTTLATTYALPSSTHKLMPFGLN